ncbi:Cytochrome P450 87A3 [Apostasia shenzhenica]|uniref:Cytochrome P450 87A3 n=1 Tax=Apostasia shenzhenica TaxID=1088818 RepID=A0A2I0B4X7_9ASPA|nr:Cytochrome P450 87A3 [Apostasia shenzhenica]
MGLPLLGETLEFFTPSSSFDIHPFIKKRMKNCTFSFRYGPVFKTRLVGRPLVASADQELNQLVFLQEGRLFESWYPESFTKIFGQDNASELHGPMFKYLKSLFLKFLGSPNLRQVLLQDVQKEALSRLLSWSTQPSIELKTQIGSMIFDVIAKKLISYDPATEKEDLKRNFSAFIRGLISFPLNIPGTAYHRCLQGRKNVINMLKELVAERMMSSPVGGDRADYLDHVVEELRKENSMLTEGVALDLVFALLYASSETPSPALTLAVKFLAENPQALQELTDEHEEILRNRKEQESGITWEEYKSMRFTFQVINETLRLANVAPVIFRKALKDIHINGYTIPAGWGVMVCPPATHLNPEIYKDPLTFNPWRWKVRKEKAETKNFMAFGGGMRLCVGAEFSKVEMAVFLHCLVTKYRWKTVRGGSIMRTPGLQFPHGYHIQVFSKE